MILSCTESPCNIDCKSLNCANHEVHCGNEKCIVHCGATLNFDAKDTNTIKTSNCQSLQICAQKANDLEVEISFSNIPNNPKSTSSIKSNVKNILPQLLDNGVISPPLNGTFKITESESASSFLTFDFDNELYLMQTQCPNNHCDKLYFNYSNPFYSSSNGRNENSIFKHEQHEQHHNTQNQRSDKNKNNKNIENIAKMGFFNNEHKNKNKNKIFNRNAFDLNFNSNKRSLLQENTTTTPSPEPAPTEGDFEEIFCVPGENVDCIVPEWLWMFGAALFLILLCLLSYLIYKCKNDPNFGATGGGSNGNASNQIKKPMMKDGKGSSDGRQKQDKDRTTSKGSSTGNYKNSLDTNDNKQAIQRMDSGDTLEMADQAGTNDPNRGTVDYGDDADELDEHDDDEKAEEYVVMCLFFRLSCVCLVFLIFLCCCARMSFLFV